MLSFIHSFISSCLSKTLFFDSYCRKLMTSIKLHHLVHLKSIGKSIAKAKQALPKHTPLKVKVISNLVTQLPPHSKTNVFSKAQRSLNKSGQARKKTTEAQDHICKIPGKARYKLLLY